MKEEVEPAGGGVGLGRLVVGDSPLDNVDELRSRESLDFGEEEGGGDEEEEEERC